MMPCLDFCGGRWNVSIIGPGRVAFFLCEAGFVCNGLCLKANNDVRRKLLQVGIVFTAAEP